MTIHVFLAFPETAGKPLEEVEEMFREGKPAWKTKVATKRIIAAERGDIEAKPGRLAHSETPPGSNGGSRLESKEGSKKEGS